MEDIDSQESEPALPAISEKPKRKAGRPPKQIINQELISRPLGIISQPSNPLFKLELSYNNPNNLKKIFDIFKAYKSPNVVLYFKQNKIIIYGKNHTQRVIIYCCIDTSKLNYYYCEKDLITFHNPNALSQALSVLLSKSNSNFKIIHKEIFDPVNNDYMKKLYFVTENIENSYKNEVELKTNFDEKTDQIAENDIPQIEDSEIYPVNFVFPFKEFKNDITNWTKITQAKTVIYRIYNNTLYVKTDGIIPFERAYNDISKIHLTHIDEMYNVTVILDNLKPFSTLKVNKDVDFYLNGGNDINVIYPILLKTVIDDSITIRVFIQKANT
jgi:hypothetical protein